MYHFVTVTFIGDQGGVVIRQGDIEGADRLFARIDTLSFAIVHTTLPIGSIIGNLIRQAACRSTDKAGRALPDGQIIESI
ncbi:MAG: hypothetical protein KZQ95_09555 [Candidatus Thiodiazotropha sp. (ex Epidulcina cf. delphinae)]|nr:hypothetical protein [Candidatus Thiodiazotropha sp. (ex Epidulcina cf. delphinae)]